jgi:uracil phosphoribosyltransferase
MMIQGNFHISNHPLVKHKLMLLRDRTTDHLKFRQLIRELAILLGYEAMDDLQLMDCSVQTPLATAPGKRLQEEVGLVPILRAGLGMVDGVLEMIPGAQVWHLGIYRDEHTLRPISYYNKLPTDPTVQVCLVLDPMLATGGSATAAIDVLKNWGVKRIKYVGLIAAPEGIAVVTKAHPDVPLYLAAIDDHLNENGYIVPGLGDAGDRQFGTA